MESGLIVKVLARKPEVHDNGISIFIRIFINHCLTRGLAIGPPNKRASLIAEGLGGSERIGMMGIEQPADGRIVSSQAKGHRVRLTAEMWALPGKTEALPPPDFFLDRQSGEK
jgi:hypothetical protein